MASSLASQRADGLTDVSKAVSRVLRTKTSSSVIAISRLRALGWEPAIPVEQNVREYVEWLQGQSVSKEFLLEAEQMMKQSGVVQRARGAGAPTIS